MVGQVLSRIVSRSCSSLMASNESGWGAPPTVLTTRSMRPNGVDRLLGQHGHGRARCPSTRRRRPRGVPRPAWPPRPKPLDPASRPLITTEAPPRASRRAQDLPMLGSAVEPVTTATRPENRWSPPTERVPVRRLCCRLRVAHVRQCASRRRSPRQTSRTVYVRPAAHGHGARATVTRWAAPPRPALPS